MFIAIGDEDLPQEKEETLNKKAGINVLTIDNSENVSTMTENYLLDMETSTLASSIELIAPPLDTSRNTLLTTPHKVGTSISEVPSPADNFLSLYIHSHYCQLLEH